VRALDKQVSVSPRARLNAVGRIMAGRASPTWPRVMVASAIVVLLLELLLFKPQRDEAMRSTLQAPAAANSIAADAPVETPVDPFIFTETGMFVTGTRTRTGVVIPVAGVTLADLENTFGAPRADGRRHVGIDIAAPTGTPLMAAVDGWVAALSYNDAGGRGLHLLDRTGQFLLYYAHLDAYAEGVFAGMAARQGELLGYVGSTGNAAMPHLHLEVGRVRGPGALQAEPLNPFAFLRGDIPLSGGGAVR
jgi:murein DD-endopeptidase MepM/ murein hydrolase activator NlpD